MSTVDDMAIFHRLETEECGLKNYSKKNYTFPETT